MEKLKENIQKFIESKEIEIGDNLKEKIKETFKKKEEDIGNEIKSILNKLSESISENIKNKDGEEGIFGSEEIQKIKDNVKKKLKKVAIKSVLESLKKK